MFRRRHHLARLLFAATVASCTTLAAQLTLVTEDYPPDNYAGSDGVPTGISTDIVREMMKRSGIGFDIRIVPWARAIAMARTQVNTCVFSMSRTPERESQYLWIGPLVTNDWVLFARNAAPPHPTARPASIEAVKNARIGSYQGDAIVTWLEARGYQVDVAPSDDDNPKKLLADRIDYWATGKLIGQYRLKQQQLETRIEAVLTFNRTEMYLACQKRTANDVVSRLNRALADMIKQGDIRKIYDSYGYQP
jgi:polar amino acid transport system substrate-binding protein